MLRIPCPKCRKTSYTSDVESFYTCNFCGFKFSGKHGPDRRRESRIEKVMPLILSFKNQDFEASTSDISDKGMCIKISSRPDIVLGDVVNVTASDFSVEAKVMWVKKLSGGAVAGFQKVIH